MQLKWVLPDLGSDQISANVLRDFGLTGFSGQLLARNGVFDDEEVGSFVRPKLKSLADPFLLPDMHAAVERLDIALRNKERIVLYGDYDVDGVSAVTILARLLRNYGGDVHCFLPMRMEEGYGLSEAGLQRCFAGTIPTLLVAVDCGTNSTAEVARVRGMGVDVIIIDHHEFAGNRPDCVALVNPKRNGQFDYLCSAGLAFKVAHAMLKYSPIPEFDLKDYLDLVALATIADLVPLIGENRILVVRGLQQLNVTRWPGLAALIQLAGITSAITSADVSFRIAPRINAAGRLGTALEALKLLLTDDPTEATALTAALDRQNQERQSVERQVIREVEQWVDSNFDPNRHATIVAGDSDWHEGVLGIVASRIMKRHHRPTLIVGFQPDGSGKGSGRSIEGFSLVEALQQCSSFLGKFGGHEMAVGLTITRENFEEFRKAFEAIAWTMIDPQTLSRILRLDAEVALHQINETLLEEQERLEPYGNGNPQPLLLVRGVVPLSPPEVKKDKHLKMEFRTANGRIDSIFFDGASVPLPPPPWDLAFRLVRNEYRGHCYPQMHIVAIRASDGISDCGLRNVE